MKIINIVVAFENIKELTTLFENILLQEIINSSIVCIDNSEINFHAIQELCYTFSKENNFKIFYYKSKTNEGSAKGFALGMQKAYELGADWIWLHDQDGYPKKGCLSSLLDSTDQENILAPCVIKENNKRLKIFSARIDKKDNWLPINVLNSKTDADIAASAGLFISRKVIDTIGVYDFNNYFVGMEDFDYCMRAKHFGFKLKIIKEALYFHPDKWKVKKWEMTRKLKYFGEYSRKENRVRGGHIVYHITHSKYLFVVSFLYSIFRVIYRYIKGYDIHLKNSLICYLPGLINKFKKNKKMVLDISELSWIVYH